MDDRTLRHRKAEAQRLANEPLLVEFLENYRTSALAGLSIVKRDDADNFYRLQAQAAISLSFVEALQGFVLAGPPDETAEPGTRSSAE
jgi:hypothetical protein